jgi:tetratricopeptide (TPR) repeat protein
MNVQFKTLKREHTLPDRRSFILYIWLLGLILRISHLLLSADNPLLYMPVLDERYYVGLGKTIACGQLTGENRVFFMDPLYGYFLAAVFFFCGDNLTTVRLIQIVLDAFNVVLIYAIGTRVWKREAGIIAALSYAVYPVAFFYSLLILKTTLCISMLLFFTLFLTYLPEKKSGLCWYGLGLFAALLTYLRGNMILLVPLVILFIPLCQRTGWAGFAKKSLLLVLGFISLLSVGVFRNFWVSGEFVVLNSQAGRLLYSCNNPGNLTGLYNVPGFARPNPVDSEIDFHKEAERRKGAPLEASEVSRYWMMETLRFFSKNPETLVRLLYHKIKGTVGGCEIANNHSYYAASRFSPLLKWPLPPFALAFAFGLPGLIPGIRKERRVAILLIPFLTVLVTILLFYTSSRFRMPAVPFLLIGAGISLSILHDWMRKRKVLKACVLISFIGIAGFLSLSVACPKPSGTEAFLMAKAYWRQKDFENAKRFALKGANDFPTQARFHVLLGMIAFSGNQPDEAIKQNEQAIRIDPGNVDAFHNMGLVYLETKRPEEAIPWFRKALALAERPDILFHLAMAYEERGDKKRAAENYQKYLDTATSADPFRDQAKRKLSAPGFRSKLQDVY